MPSEPGNPEADYKVVRLKSGLNLRGAKTRRELRQDKGQLSELVRTDYLTGLPNEKAFGEMLDGLQNRWESFNNRRSAEQLLAGSIVVADLVHLKKTNDVYGREAGGDSYIKAVATALKETARKGDRIFRLGSASDEFVLYLPDVVSAGHVDKVLDRIDEELKFKQGRLQESYPGIIIKLSYSASSFGKLAAPRWAYSSAANNLGEAKKAGGGNRVGDVGRIYDNSFYE